jgi:hypothetical protein
VSGESGGIGRLNVDRVNSQCDPIAERECQKPFNVFSLLAGFNDHQPWLESFKNYW